MKILEISLSEALRANEILHDTRLDREIFQVSSDRYQFVDNDDDDLQSSIIDALCAGGVNEFDIW